ncbi:MAG: tyrosine-type recombinase/integrase [Rhizobiales bacterium]|nr:tyrosine-type recombinase/integrase [Hyphomicrobiales bacterium]
MTGHIRRRGKNSFELKFDAGRDPATGKRRIRYHSFKGGKRAAELELVRLVAEHDAGNSVDPSRVTVAEFFDRWDRDWASANVSPKTLERYRQIARLQIKPHVGNLAIQKLRPLHLADLYAKLGRGEKALAARSVGHVHRLIHRVLRHAAAWGVVTQNVAAHVQPPTVDETEISILTEDQIGRVLDHLQGRTLRPIVSLALVTGMRRGELLALRWKDADLDSGMITVARSLEQTKGSLRFKGPKTKHGRRKISIPPWMVAELRAHKARQQELRLRLGMGRAPDDSLVFAKWNGAPRAPHPVSQKFRMAMAALKIEGVTFHSLRHFHASALIASGMDVLTISRRLGHGSPVITLKTYGHLFSNTDARAAEIMQAAFAKARTE